MYRARRINFPYFFGEQGYEIMLLECYVKIERFCEDAWLRMTFLEFVTVTSEKLKLTDRLEISGYTKR